GLGNSANDLPLLRQVDRPISIRNPDRSYDLEIVKKLPHIERTQGIGPHGWREAVERILADPC
ncbi:MAG: mannosyl-3-phosphoglycerate phosphatase, partial [Thermodesulfobacteriota bacterium]